MDNMDNIEDLVWQLTPDQAARWVRATGISFSEIVVKRIFLKLAAVVALQTQSATLLVSDSPDALQLMKSGGLEAVELSHFVFSIALDSLQRRQLWEATGQNFEFLAILPDDYKVAYPEGWEKVPFSIDVGQLLTISNCVGAVRDINGRRQTVLLEANDFTGFGTGTHSTTQMCLELIEETLCAGQQILEVGTGSGILAIACAKLGAASVIASDVDEQAVRAAQRNVRINGSDEIVRVELGTLTDEEARGEVQQYDLILANLFPSVLKSLFPRFRQRLKPGGRLIISGVAAGRAPDVALSWQQAGFTLVQRREQNIWVAFVLQ